MLVSSVFLQPQFYNHIKFGNPRLQLPILKATQSNDPQAYMLLNKKQEIEFETNKQKAATEGYSGDVLLQRARFLMREEPPYLAAFPIATLQGSTISYFERSNLPEARDGDMVIVYATNADPRYMLRDATTSIRQHQWHGVIYRPETQTILYCFDMNDDTQLEPAFSVVSGDGRFIRGSRDAKHPHFRIWHPDAPEDYEQCARIIELINSAKTMTLVPAPPLG